MNTQTYEYDRATEFYDKEIDSESSVYKRKTIKKNIEGFNKMTRKKV